MLGLGFSTSNQRWRRPAPSVITLDLTGPSLPSQVSLARASGATYINASGGVATASADTARFDHDPASHQPKGLLLEAAASNLLLHSSGFSDAVWTKTDFNTSGLAPVIQSTTEAAPDGTMTATQVTLDAVDAAGQSSLHQSIPQQPSAIYCLSVWLRVPAGSPDAILRLRIDYVGGTFSQNVTVSDSWARHSLTTPTAAAVKSVTAARVRPALGTSYLGHDPHLGRADRSKRRADKLCGFGWKRRAAGGGCARDRRTVRQL